MVRQGTLFGVFFPVMQNIFGVLLFIRVPRLTAEAGIWQMTLVVLMSIFCTFFAILSMSAIATNGKIKAGGPYYMIARSLGPAPGGSVGLLYFLANTFGAAMYILGAVETFLLWSEIDIFSEFWNLRLWSIMVLAILGFINFIGL